MVTVFKVNLRSRENCNCDDLNRSKLQSHECNGSDRKAPAILSQY